MGKHEDLGLNPQHPHTKLGMAAWPFSFSTIGAGGGEADTGRLLGLDCSPANLQV